MIYSLSHFSSFQVRYHPCSSNTWWKSRLSSIDRWLLCSYPLDSLMILCAFVKLLSFSSFSFTIYVIFELCKLIPFSRYDLRIMGAICFILWWFWWLYVWISQKRFVNIWFIYINCVLWHGVFGQFTNEILLNFQ